MKIAVDAMGGDFGPAVVVEGAVTARAVPVLAARFGVEMPICEALHAVLCGGKAPADAGRDLMARAAKAEGE